MQLFSIPSIWYGFKHGAFVEAQIKILRQAMIARGWCKEVQEMEVLQLWLLVKESNIRTQSNEYLKAALNDFYLRTRPMLDELNDKMLGRGDGKVAAKS